MYTPRTPVENPYCRRQLPTDEPIAVAFPRVGSLAAQGWCPDCGKLVALRRNGTARLHKVYGRREAARRIAAYKRGEKI